MGVEQIAIAGIPAVFNLIKSLLPLLPTASSGVVTAVLSVLTEWGPLAIQEYQELKPVVSDTIDMLEQSDHTTAETIATLRTQLVSDKTDFDKAVADSRAGDKAAGY